MQHNGSGGGVDMEPTQVGYWVLGQWGEGAVTLVVLGAGSVASRGGLYWAETLGEPSNLVVHWITTPEANEGTLVARIHAVTNPAPFSDSFYPGHESVLLTSASVPLVNDDPSGGEIAYDISPLVTEMVTEHGWKGGDPFALAVFTDETVDDFQWILYHPALAALGSAPPSLVFSGGDVSIGQVTVADESVYGLSVSDESVYSVDLDVSP